MSKNWIMIVELEFPVKDPEDNVPMFSGDAEIDFANRAVQRIRPELDKLVGEDGKFAHYYIMPLKDGKRARRGV